MDIGQILQSLRPNSVYCMNGPLYADLVWMDDTQTKPTEEEVIAAEAGVLIREAIAQEIDRLEAEVSPRRIREAVLGTDGGWLAAQEALIATQRGLLT